jgi:chaperone modulatory protein CbpM
MADAEELIALLDDLDADELHRWVRDALVEPERAGPSLHFPERAAARVRLLCSLRYEMGVEADTLPLLVSVLDRLHETHAHLRLLGAAVAAQDTRTREAVLAVLHAARAAAAEDEGNPG